MKISRPGYLKRRMKLNPDAYLCCFYADGGYKTYDRYLVPAADGSTIVSRNKVNSGRENTKPRAAPGPGCLYDAHNRLPALQV